MHDQKVLDPPWKACLRLARTPILSSNLQLYLKKNSKACDELLKTSSCRYAYIGTGPGFRLLCQWVISSFQCKMPLTILLRNMTPYSILEFAEQEAWWMSSKADREVFDPRLNGSKADRNNWMILLRTRCLHIGLACSSTQAWLSWPQVSCNHIPKPLAPSSHHDPKPVRFLLKIEPIGRLGSKTLKAKGAFYTTCQPCTYSYLKKSFN